MVWCPCQVNVSGGEMGPFVDTGGVHSNSTATPCCLAVSAVTTQVDFYPHIQHTEAFSYFSANSGLCTARLKMTLLLTLLRLFELLRL